MKRLTALICILTVLAVYVCPAAADFNDMVDSSHWGYNALEYAVSNSVIKGFDDNTVRPTENLTRAQMATIVIRLIRTVAIADMDQFSDVDKSAWYFSSMESAVGLGIFRGSGDGHLYPNNPITRQETFAVIARLLALKEKSGDTEFADDGSVAAWAKGSIKAMYDAGYISGDNLKNVNPLNLISRVEFAQLVYNIYQVNKEDSAEGNGSDSSLVSVFGKIRAANNSGNSEDSFTGREPHQSNVDVYFDEDDPFADTFAYDLFDDEK